MKLKAFSLISFNTYDVTITYLSVRSKSEKKRVVETTLRIFTLHSTPFSSLHIDSRKALYYKQEIVKKEPMESKELEQ